MHVYVEPTRYEVSCLPPEYRARRYFTLTVEYRGNDRWAICRHGMCYDTDGNCEYEFLSSSRDSDLLARFRFPLDEALIIAQRLAPDLRVNQFTVTDALANGPEWL